MKKRVAIVSLVLAVAVLLGAVAAIVLPIVTHKSAGSSGWQQAAVAANSVTAVGADQRTRQLTVTDEAGNPATMDALKPGSTIKVAGTGYDSEIGIYVSFCKIPATDNERPSPCLGEVPASESAAAAAADSKLSSAWVTDDLVWQTFATHNFSDAAKGSFEVELVVPVGAGNGVDCAVDSCALVTRADHTALNDRVQDMVLPVKFSQ